MWPKDPLSKIYRQRRILFDIKNIQDILFVNVIRKMTFCNVEDIVSSYSALSYKREMKHETIFFNGIKCDF